MSTRYGRRQAGLGLIEVLVTLVICTVGVLGLVALQARSQLAEMEGYQRAQAVVLLEDMAQRLNANSTNVTGYVTGTSTSSALGTGNSTYSPSTGCASYAVGSAARDMCEWSNLLVGAAEKSSSGNYVGALLSAYGCIEQIQAVNNTNGSCQAGIYRVTVTWQGLSATSANAPSLQCAQSAFASSPGEQRSIAEYVTIGTPTCS